MTNEEHANMQDVVLICTDFSNQQTVGRYEEMKLFNGYVDDIICMVCVEPEEYLRFTNSLHDNPILTLEKVNMERDLAFLDININVSIKSNIACHCYQKPTDTGVVMNFCICSPLQHKKNSRDGSQGF